MHEEDVLDFAHCAKVGVECDKAREWGDGLDEEISSGAVIPKRPPEGVQGGDC